jgi:hypothetical protein
VISDLNSGNASADGFDLICRLDWYKQSETTAYDSTAFMTQDYWKYSLQSNISEKTGTMSNR